MTASTAAAEILICSAASLTLGSLQMYSCVPFDQGRGSTCRWQQCSMALSASLLWVWPFPYRCSGVLHPDFVYTDGCNAGHYENDRDVVNVSNDLGTLPEQQGFLQCVSLPPPAHPEAHAPQRDVDPGRLTHFFLRVSNKMRAHGDLSTLTQFEQVCSANPCCRTCS